MIQLREESGLGYTLILGELRKLGNSSFASDGQEHSRGGGPHP